MQDTDVPSFFEFLLPGIPWLLVLVVLWVMIRRFFRRIGRHIEQTERHQERVEAALEELKRRADR